jgi:hypothetical protein
LTISGIARQEWSVSDAPVQSGDCERTEGSDGLRSVRFQTREAIVVRLAGGRVLPVAVPEIAGRDILRGANTTKEICAGVESAEIADCVQLKRSFSGATVRMSSPRAGFLDVQVASGIRLAAASCPREPAEVRSRPLGPPLSLVRLPREALQEQRLTRMNLRVSRNQRKVYGAPQAGRLVESAEWTLTFVRIKG